VSEQELVERSKEGDQNAFRQLYDSHVDRVFRLTYRMAGDEELARDYTQEAFIRAYQKLEQFRGDSRFGTWMHSIAVSVTLNGLRKQKRTRERETALEKAPQISGRPEVGAEVRSRLKEAIEALPELYRTVFLMHDLEGYSHGEIATALDVAEGTSKARLSRARAKLRDLLGDFAQEYA